MPRRRVCETPWVLLAMMAGAAVLWAASACAAAPAGAASPATRPAPLGPPGPVYLVSPSGDDSGDGSQSRPFRTIARALEKAGPSVTIRLRAGTYHEAVTITKGSQAERWSFLLESAPGERAVLDGNFGLAAGVTVRAPYVSVRGLEIRNYCSDGILVDGPAAHHVTVEKNVIHHITGSLAGEAAEGSRGIRAKAASDCTIRNNTVYFVVGHSECFGILYDLRSGMKVPIHRLVIENNLLYFLDKSGVRVVDNTALGEGRCRVLANAAHIRGNISIHNPYVGLEVNYVGTAFGRAPGPLGEGNAAPVYTEDNFIGWCGSYGLNPKQSRGGISRHNTIYRTAGIGYLQSGDPSSDMEVTGNLLADNVIGSFIHTEGNRCRFVGNYYRQAAPWLDFFGDRTKGWGTMYTRMNDLRSRSNQRPEANGILDSGGPLFAAPDKGDFRLAKGSPAAGAAPDGDDFGVRARFLPSGVGASGRWGLANVPILPELAPLRVVGCSSKDPNSGPFDRDEYYPSRSGSIDNRKISTGLAAHLVDGSMNTVWRPAGGATSGWVAFELPGREPVPLGAFMVLGHRVRHQEANFLACQCHPRELRLSVRLSEKEAWKEVGRFVRHVREEGRIFPIPFAPAEGPPKARQVKLEVLSNHGAPVLEVPEFRLYRAMEPVE